MIFSRELFEKCIFIFSATAHRAMIYKDVVDFIRLPHADRFACLYHVSRRKLLLSLNDIGAGIKYKGVTKSEKKKKTGTKNQNKKIGAVANRSPYKYMRKHDEIIPMGLVLAHGVVGLFSSFIFKKFFLLEFCERSPLLFVGGRTVIELRKYIRFVTCTS